LIELLLRLRRLAGANIGVNPRKLLDLGFGFLHLMLAPPDQAAARREEQDDARNQPVAVGLEKVAHLIATQILIHLAEKRLTSIRGLRQRASVRSIGDPIAGTSLPHPGLTEAGGASSSG